MFFKDAEEYPEFPPVEAGQVVALGNADGDKIYVLMFNEEYLRKYTDWSDEVFGLIAHECVHLVMNIMTDINEPNPCHETMCYGVQMLSVEVRKLIRETYGI